MKTFLVTFKGKNSVQTMRLSAKNAEDAQKQAEDAQRRRHQRFDLTFARLDEAEQTGQAGMLAIDPKFGTHALTEAWVKAEREMRKRDHGRYESGELKVVKVEEEK